MKGTHAKKKSVKYMMGAVCAEVEYTGYDWHYVQERSVEGTTGAVCVDE